MWVWWGQTATCGTAVCEVGPKYWEEQVGEFNVVLSGLMVC